MNLQLLLARCLPHLLGVCLLLLGSSWAHAKFILFPTLTLKSHQGANPHAACSAPKQSALGAQLDLFYADDSGRLRFLPEALLTPEQHPKRLQVGWPFMPGTAIWAFYGVGAKGVDNIQIADKLKNLGCDHAQGYYFGHPLPADKVTLLLNESHQPASN
ncbi:MAG: hypothetical protein Q8L89_00175 [Gammaproteobacteria bacterium]|nr:hypothetical protein [Gammaproteobacteria bacterium]